MSISVEMRLLGGFGLDADGQPVVVPAGAERMLAYLALRSGSPSRLHVASVLWTDSPEPRALGNLRSTLWRIEQVAVPLVSRQGDRLSLESDVHVDVDAVSTLARRCRDGAVPDELESVDLLAGANELLPDWYDDWALLARERFRLLRLQGLERLALELARTADYAHALDAALAAVGSEPLRESAQRALMTVHLAQGNRAEAMRQYARFASYLQAELDVAPSFALSDVLGLPADTHPYEGRASTRH